MVVLLWLCLGVFISYVRLLPTKQIATYIQTGAKSNQGDGVARIQCSVRASRSSARGMQALEMLPVSRSVRTTRSSGTRALDRLTQDSFVSLMEYKVVDVFDRMPA
mgnify:CR=1 FL=1